MNSKPTEEEVQRFHRYFAIECNNLAWGLSTSERNEEQDMQMLDAAHASAFHWKIVGNELNVMRSKMLLAEVHALLGHGELAFNMATKMKAYFLAQDTPDWELGFTHAIYAHAAYVAGNIESYKVAYQEAQDAISAIADEEDRKIVLQTFASVPSPS